MKNAGITAALWGVFFVVSGLLPAALAKEATTGQNSQVLYPKSGQSGLRPAVILLPFTGGDAQRLFDWHYTESLPALAADENLLIVIPEGSGSYEDYATGAAWTATLERYTRDIAADAEELVQKHGADPKRIFLVGYSMGGDLAWALVQRDPNRYAGALVMGSRASYRAKGALEKLKTNGARMALFMADGEEDARLAGMAAARGALDKVGLPYRSFQAEGGHDPAPAEVFDQALRYLLGADRSTASLPPAVAAPLPESASPVVATTGAPILKSLPGCGWEPFEDASGRYGYKDARGNVVVKPRFAFAQPFGALGVAEAVQDKSFGYFNCKGTFFEVVNIDTAPDRFREGLVRIRANDRIGYANLLGETVIAPRFEDAEGFCRGVARIGERCTAKKEGEYTMVNCRKTRYIDTAGAFVAKPAQESDPDRCDIAAETTEVVDALPRCDWKPFEKPGAGEDGEPRFGFVNGKGKVVVKPEYQWADAFGTDGLAPVQTANFAGGYINCKGEFLDTFWNGGPDAFSEGLVRFEHYDRAGRMMGVGYRNRAGKIVIAGQHNYASPFCGGKARVCMSYSMDRGNGGPADKIEGIDCSDDWRYINRQGQEITVGDDEEEWACGW